RFFRAGLGEGVHRPLNGPYPPGSWACNPELKADLFDAALARAQLAESKKTNVRLTLKYPADEPGLAPAMEYLKTQLLNTLGVELDLRPVPLRRLHEEVVDQDYELAYYWYDYPDQTYWLWPLLDPRSAQPGGRNFLAYTKGAGLEKLFREAMGHRDFNRVKAITHTIHRVFAQQEMPFIPLWQLDRHVVVHNDLQLFEGSRAV